MFQLDKWIIDFINSQFPHSYSFYKIVFFISDDNLLKGGVLGLMIWYLWFKNNDDESKNKRIHIIATVLSAFVTIIVSRSVTLLAPFRSRPVLNHDISYFSFPTDNSTIDKMSSFPSDHAALFISLAVGLLFVSKRVGTLAVIYTTVFILFPRIYLGYHYPTDIFAGAFIGIIVTVFFNKAKFVENFILNRIMTFSNRYPHWFYPLSFLITFQIVVLFSDFRSIAMFIGHNKW